MVLLHRQGPYLWQMGLTKVLIVVPAARLCMEEDLNVLAVWAPAQTLPQLLDPKAQ